MPPPSDWPTTVARRLPEEVHHVAERVGMSTERVRSPRFVRLAMSEQVGGHNREAL
jgi:hypothetical protein